jgi:hypothetical protein
MLIQACAPANQQGFSLAPRKHAHMIAGFFLYASPALLSAASEINRKLQLFSIVEHVPLSG